MLLEEIFLKQFCLCVMQSSLLRGRAPARGDICGVAIFIMRDRSMRSGTELIGQQQENKSNLSNRSSGVQISRDICTRFGHYLYSTKCSWIINGGSLY